MDTHHSPHFTNKVPAIFTTGHRSPDHDWRVSRYLLDNPRLKRLTADWEQRHAEKLTPQQIKALSKLSDCLDGAYGEWHRTSHEEITLQFEIFADSHSRYIKALLKGMRCNLYELGHPLLKEWIVQLRGWGERRFLHNRLSRTHPHLEQGVREPLSLREVALEYEIVTLLKQGVTKSKE